MYLSDHIYTQTPLKFSIVFQISIWLRGYSTNNNSLCISFMQFFVPMLYITIKTILKDF